MYIYEGFLTSLEISFPPKIYEEKGDLQVYPLSLIVGKMFQEALILKYTKDKSNFEQYYLQKKF